MKKKTIMFGGITVSALLILLFALFVWGPGRSDDDEKPADTMKGPSFSEFFSFGTNDRGYQIRQAADLRDEAKEMRELAAFPPDSRPFPRETDPTRRRFENPHMQVRDERKSDSPVLVHYMEKKNVDAGQPAVIHMMLLDAAQRRLPIKSGEIRVRDTNRAVVLNVVPLDNGANPDAKAGDLEYTVSLPVKADGVNLPFDVYIKVEQDGYLIKAMNGFTVGTLGIRHVGMTDRVGVDSTGSHLFVDVQFEVQTAGRFFAQASLYAPDGEPIMSASNGIEMGVGKHTMTLRFFGKGICDAKANGPYTLRYFGYMNSSKMPGIFSQLYENVHRTAPYSHTQFTCKAFADPALMKKAEAIDDDALHAERKSR